MKGSNFIFDCVHVLYYKCYEINLNCSGSYIDSPDWIKKKITTINPVNDNCFKYAATFALDHKEIGTHPQRILKMKPFINKYS